MVRMQTSDAAIVIEGLGKRYSLGARHDTYKTLRDTIARGFRPRAAEDEDILWALRDIDLEFAQGQAVGVIGRNGAGKSTLLKILARVTAPTEGTARLNGRVGSLLEVGTGFHPELTGRENIYLNGAILGMHRAEITRKFDEIVEFSEIEAFLDTPVKRYSSGMYVRLAFAVAAHLEPEILLVDEVLAVGDLAFRRKCLGKMGDISHAGRTVIFVSHTLSAIRQLCTHAVWIDKGRVAMTGSADEVTAAYERASMAEVEEMVSRRKRDPQETVGKQAWIDWVDLRDGSREPCAQFAAGDEIVLDVGIGGDPTEGFSVDWFVSNERGEKVAFGSASPSHGLTFDEGVRAVRCVLGPIPFTRGFYRLRVGCTVWGQRYWDEWEGAGAFQVVRCDPYGVGGDHFYPVFGSSVLRHEWSVLDRGDVS
jgi:lipopolysaccharide transport system ATP-binding protein